MPIKIHKVLSLGILAICILITGCDDEVETGSIAFSFEGTSISIDPNINTIEVDEELFDLGNTVFQNSAGYLSWNVVDVGTYTFTVEAKYIIGLDTLYNYITGDTSVTVSADVSKDGYTYVNGLSGYEYSITKSE